MAVPVTLGTNTYSIPQTGDTDWGSALSSWVVAANGALVTGNSNYNVKLLGGAKGDGVTDDSTAFQNALNTNKYVVVPAGTYILNSSISIPADTTVTLLPGAVLAPAAPIVINASRARLVGGARYKSGNLTSTGFFPNIKWRGAVSNSVLKIGAAATTGLLGIEVSGISIDGNGVASITGITMGSATGNFSDSIFSDISLTNVANGLDIVGSIQNCYFDRLVIYNPDNGNTTPPSSGFGIRIGGPLAASTITTLWFTSGRVQGFTNAVLSGDTADGASAHGGNFIWFSGYQIDNLPLNGGAGFNIRTNATGFWIDKCWIQGPLGEVGSPPSTTRGIIVGTNGSVTGAPRLVVVSNSQLTGFSTLIEGFQWQGLSVHDNFLTIGSLDGNGIVFLNSGSGTPAQRGGNWGYNFVIPGSVAPVELSSFAGFERVQMAGMDQPVWGNRYNPITKISTSEVRVINSGGALEKVCENYRGFLYVFDNLTTPTTPVYARLLVPGGGAAPIIIEQDASTTFTVTAANATTLNVYWDGAKYVLENKTATNRQFHIRQEVY